MARLVPKLNVVQQTARPPPRRARAARRAPARADARVGHARARHAARPRRSTPTAASCAAIPELQADWKTLVAQGGAAARPRRVLPHHRRDVRRPARAARADLAPLVRARRAELARDQARPDPPATFVGTPPPVVLPPSGGDVMRGLPASAGVVEGRARVLFREEDMDSLQPGEVLVVHTTDVGWTPLFLVAAGVVTELGGPLSHAAVVAREFGVPTVVNVVGATRVLRTGDVLRVDGDRGTVERVRG